MGHEVTITVPPMHAELAQIVPYLPALPHDLDVVAVNAATSSSAEAILEKFPDIQHKEHTITGPDNNDIIMSVFSPKEPTSKTLPCIYHIHPGGMVLGNRFTEVISMISVVKEVTESVYVSIEYRLAPETRAPGPAEDCYAGLLWTHKNADLLGINPSDIVVWGLSGGACLASAVGLICRDRKSVPIRSLMLLSPMLDDTCSTVSHQQFETDSPTWTNNWNRTAWSHVLGDKYGTVNITPYESPSRATDLSNLPPTYIDVGERDVFRDPAVDFSKKLWGSGTTCELHVWPGAFHIFDCSEHFIWSVGNAANEAKQFWLKRIFSL